MSNECIAIKVQNLKHSYLERGLVLNIPEFQLHRAETVFLYGPSGSGKTTLLSLLTGIMAIQAGHVELFGQPMERLGARARDILRASHIGYIFQVFNLLPFLSVRENILLPLRMSSQRRERLGGSVSADDEAARLATALSIGHLLNAKAGELSIGQQQRVAAARALIGAPDLIIADEPTSALDSEMRESFLRVLFEQAQRQKSAVLFVSHDRSLSPLFDRTVALSEINSVQLEGV
jgi:putative ABC transport system ATP-binding protein